MAERNVQWWADVHAASNVGLMKYFIHSRLRTHFLCTELEDCCIGYTKRLFPSSQRFCDEDSNNRSFNVIS